MAPELIAQLVVMYGLPFAERMIALWQTKTAVTQEEWQKLVALVETPENALAKVAAAAGLAMDDARIVTLKNLIQP